MALGTLTNDPYPSAGFNRKNDLRDWQHWDRARVIRENARQQVQPLGWTTPPPTPPSFVVNPTPTPMGLGELFGYEGPPYTPQWYELPDRYYNPAFGAVPVPRGGQPSSGPSGALRTRVATSGTLEGYKSRVFSETGGKIRNQPISADLQRVLDAAAAAADVTVRVVSGGQPAKGSGGRRVGSTRHDLGGAADLQLIKDGRTLDFTNPSDRTVFERFIAAAAANGATGFGGDIDYMGPKTVHVGFGNQAVWGAGGKVKNAPGWLVDAVSAVRKSSIPLTASPPMPRPRPPSSTLLAAQDQRPGSTTLALPPMPRPKPATPAVRVSPGIASAVDRPATRPLAMSGMPPINEFPFSPLTSMWGASNVLANMRGAQFPPSGTPMAPSGMIRAPQRAYNPLADYANEVPYERLEGGRPVLTAGSSTRVPPTSYKPPYSPLAEIFGQVPGARPLARAASPVPVRTPVPMRDPVVPPVVASAPAQARAPSGFRVISTGAGGTALVPISSSSASSAPSRSVSRSAPSATKPSASRSTPSATLRSAQSQAPGYTSAWR